MNRANWDGHPFSTQYKRKFLIRRSKSNLSTNYAIYIYIFLFKHQNMLQKNPEIPFLIRFLSL